MEDERPLGEVWQHKYHSQPQDHYSQHQSNHPNQQQYQPQQLQHQNNLFQRQLHPEQPYFQPGQQQNLVEHSQNQLFFQQQSHHQQQNIPYQPKEPQFQPEQPHFPPKQHFYPQQHRNQYFPQQQCYPPQYYYQEELYNQVVPEPEEQPSRMEYLLEKLLLDLEAKNKAQEARDMAQEIRNQEIDAELRATQALIDMLENQLGQIAMMFTDRVQRELSCAMVETLECHDSQHVSAVTSMDYDCENERGAVSEFVGTVLEVMDEAKEAKEESENVEDQLETKMDQVQFTSPQSTACVPPPLSSSFPEYKPKVPFPSRLYQEPIVEPNSKIVDFISEMESNLPFLKNVLQKRKHKEAFKEFLLKTKMSRDDDKEPKKPPDLPPKQEDNDALWEEVFVLEKKGQNSDIPKVLQPLLSSRNEVNVAVQTAPKRCDFGPENVVSGLPHLAYLKPTLKCHFPPKKRLLVDYLEDTKGMTSGFTLQGILSDNELVQDKTLSFKSDTHPGVKEKKKKLSKKDKKVK